MPGVVISYDNNSKGIFYSGQSLGGTIHFDNEKSRKFHSISLTFEGFAKVLNKENIKLLDTILIFSVNGRKRKLKITPLLIEADKTLSIK